MCVCVFDMFVLFVRCSRVKIDSCSSPLFFYLLYLRNTSFHHTKQRLIHQGKKNTEPDTKGECATYKYAGDINEKEKKNCIRKYSLVLRSVSIEFPLSVQMVVSS